MSLDVKFVQLRIFLTYLENIDSNIRNSCKIQNREYVTTNTISALGEPLQSFYYRPQRSFGKVIFSQACVKNSVRGGCLPQCMLGYTHNPPDRPPPADGYCSGQYASYWNAFLLLVVIPQFYLFVGNTEERPWFG